MLHELIAQGFHVKRQAIIPIKYKGIHFDEGLRLDLLVNNAVIVEIKAMDTVNAVWEAQILSQLKLSELKLGYLINFGNYIFGCTNFLSYISFIIDTNDSEI